MAAQHALLFDCDGVIVETEELHRLSYNKAFDFYGIHLPDETKVEWSVEYYDKLQNTIGGGKPKMKYYFNNDAKTWPIGTRPYMPPPTSDEAKDALVDMLQDKKTEFYKQVIEELATARPGVLELMDAAIADPTLKVGICSASTKAGFVKLTNAIVGEERLSKLDVVMAGDDVTEKKPDPMIYNVARERIGIAPENCIVIEDSLIGLQAAKAAGMKCVITYTESTKNENFYGTGASATLLDLTGVTLSDLFDPLRAGNPHGILEKFRDPKTGRRNSPVETPIRSTKEDVRAKLGWVLDDILVAK
jgi:HAD superfamily hydrolase (TIGR01509 family)